MALSEFQRGVCRLIAGGRIASGESYVAGGAALNELLQAARRSHDIDLFHDTAEAVLASWEADRALLLREGFEVRPTRIFTAFVEASVERGGEAVVLQWVQDSAFRFFPLLEHPDFGLTLHPFDLATNKTLALIGRAEVRDWVDIISCHTALQAFGLLVWAACGKDPSLGPDFILEQARRSARYAKPDLERLAFDGEAPNPQRLGNIWRRMLAEAEEISALLPENHVGQCVLDCEAGLFKGSLSALRQAVANNTLRFHEGRIRGAWPSVVNQN
ncbi:MAG: hypothetical protein WCS95_01850 [Lentisphaeria bacterium]